jgi:hypothetical protein
MGPLAQAAHDYIAWGLRVIALNGKAPNGLVHRRGLYDALDAESDPTGIEAAFSHPQTTGIGILTTWPLIVVDIDGEDGAAQWLEMSGGYMPDRWVAKTGRGLHMYFASIEPTGSAKMGSKLDLKGEGGYVAAPPSRHPDGHFYEWLLPPGECMLLEAPEPLEEYIRLRNASIEMREVGNTHRKRVRHKPFEDGILYASWGFEKLYEGMERAEEGNRNRYLHWAACVMSEDGAFDDDFEELRQRALRAGLSPQEVRQTIRSARKVTRD